MNYNILGYIGCAFIVWAIVGTLINIIGAIFTNCFGYSFIVTSKYKQKGLTSTFEDKKCIRAWSSKQAFIKYLKQVDDFDDRSVLSNNITEVENT